MNTPSLPTAHLPVQSHGLPHPKRIAKGKRLRERCPRRRYRQRLKKALAEPAHAAEFAMRYAVQNEQDHAALQAAVHSGRIEARSDVA